MCEGIKLIREKMEKTINTSAGRKEEQMLFQITSVHVKKKLITTPRRPQSCQREVQEIVGMT